MSVKWNGGIVLQQISRGVEDGLEVAAYAVLDRGNALIRDPAKHGHIYDSLFFTVGSGRGRVVVPYGKRDLHQASAPGEAPANDSGALIASGSYKVYSDYSAVVQWSAPHAALLEAGTDRMAPRPFASTALAETRPVIEELMAGSIQARLT